MINKLLRQNIKDIKAYSSARNEFEGYAEIYLDANENSYGSVGGGAFNRYPDPLQLKLKSTISKIKSAKIENIFLGNGSDEAIDIIIRAVCNPFKDNIITITPSYGMYKICAEINAVGIKEIQLNYDFTFNADSILNVVNEDTKIIFLCSPNNPTGKIIPTEIIEKLLTNFNGLVIIDEAYIDFSEQDSWLKRLYEYTNLIVLQTFSKAWGLSGIRLGCAYAHRDIIDVMNKIKMPYNINGITQDLAINAINYFKQKDEFVERIVNQRELVKTKLTELLCVDTVFDSDANFLLVKVSDANNIYNYLKNRGIVVRNRTNETLLKNCLRITIGTELENVKLINALVEFNL